MTTNTNDYMPDTTFTSTTGVDAEIGSYFALDRYFDDTLVLPFSFKDIKIKTNELCVADNINASLFKLHYNFLYLNAQTKIASNDFPKVFRGYIGSTQASGPNLFGWYTHGDALSTYSNAVSSQLATTNTILSGVVDGVFAQSLGLADYYAGFVATSGRLIGFRSNMDDSQVDIRLNKTTIEDATSLGFTNIKQLGYSSDNKLYVLDAYTVHKFDVDSILTNNPAISAIGRFLIKSLGGRATSLFEKSKFVNPVAITLGKDDDVYVLDHGGNGYKVYDKDLNWRYTNSRKNDFTQLSGGSVVDIAVDRTSDYVYVLVDNGIILEYDENGLLKEKHTLVERLALNEKYRRLTFSRIYDDVLYVITNQSAYKKFKTKLSRSIGAFRMNKPTNRIEHEDLKFIDVMRTEETSFDYVFVGADSTFYTSASKPKGKIFKFNEKMNYMTVAYDTYKSHVYSLSAINIDKEEYVTSWVINKSLHKLLYNHLLFRDNIHSRYLSRFDDQGRSQYMGIRYITDTDPNLFMYQPTLDNFIGLNEPVLAGTINRPLEVMYNLQFDLLNMMRESVTNKFPYPEHVVGTK